MSRHFFAVRTGRDAPAAVRDALRECGGHLSRMLREDLMLLLTELVTNAVRHSGAEDGAPIEVEVSEKPDCVYVAVLDPGDGFDRPQRLELDLSRTGGLGLVLVDRLSRTWGTRRTRRGALVWFELPYEREEDRIDASSA